MQPKLGMSGALPPFLIHDFVVWVRQLYLFYLEWYVVSIHQVGGWRKSPLTLLLAIMRHFSFRFVLLTGIIWVTKSMEKRLARHVACMGARIGLWREVVEKSEKKETLVRPWLDGRIILKWLFKKRNGTWTCLIGLSIETGGMLLHRR